MFRVIVAGGRDFGDYQLLRKTLDNLLCNITEEIVVVCGQAKGADTIMMVLTHWESSTPRKEDMQ